MRIVALTGYQQTGKTEIARYLERRWGFRLVPLRAPAVAMMQALGIAEDYFSPQRQHCRCDDLPVTPAKAIETLMESWGRLCLDDRFWLSRWEARVGTLPPRANIVVDDIGRADEATAIRALGGKVWRVNHPKRHARNAREEANMDGIEEDRSVYNGKGLKELFRSIDGLILDQK
ncbi:hypothetical protein [Roseococcus pinisoli]|uniref:Deoxynucleotide monophosphate kinase n=1 Tax=Roseococcus pinisoli TaxID=2835040 RepID=A0ABS5QHC1_9PROT|nr:hypothetical protein [Roseococcus pinisoli]MBS7812332.1 hypothetical protein [Roseococcus pinisoli]